MKYAEHPILPELTGFIQVLWTMDSETAEDRFPREQIMPDGIVEIIFHYRDPYYTFQGDKKFLQPESFAISMMQRCVEIESAGQTGFISVRFFPWGAYHFFDHPVREFLDDTISTRELWPLQYETLMHSIRAAATTEERVALVQQFLLERLKEYKKDERGMDDALRLIRQTKGMLSIEEICERTGFSKKQLERKMLATAGTTPKVFSRITRFLSICHNLKEHENRPLTQLAYDCGFYDQAHFIKEFKAFSGFTPKDFFERNNVVFSDL